MLDDVYMKFFLVLHVSKSLYRYLVIKIQQLWYKYIDYREKCGIPSELISLPIIKIICEFIIEESFVYSAQEMLRDDERGCITETEMTM